ncbi:hypothetical protein SDC9_152540 [bioreactor metagenome]|uniref:Uncharacterized protein n=1 Tax=bioreactor metagenome TaxID=1076179 RepID=A0A645EV11_9ZZZZ
MYKGSIGIVIVRYFLDAVLVVGIKSGNTTINFGIREYVVDIRRTDKFRFETWHCFIRNSRGGISIVRQRSLSFEHPIQREQVTSIQLINHSRFNSRINKIMYFPFSVRIGRIASVFHFSIPKERSSR